MHGYLADLKLRLVGLFGGESATEMRESLVTMRSQM